MGYLSPSEEKNFKKNNKDKSALIINREKWPIFSGVQKKFSKGFIINREKLIFFKVCDGIIFEKFSCLKTLS